MSPESPEFQNKKQEIIENEHLLVPPPLEQPIENTVQIEAVKVESKQERLAQIEKLKEELGISAEVKPEKSLDQITTEKKKEYWEKEDKENISTSMRNLSRHLDELSTTIARKGLPKVKFESEQLTKVSSTERIDEKGISNGLEDLTLKISKIRIPEDRREVAVLEPHNIRKVVDEMENVGGDLLKLKGVFDNARSADYTDLAKLTSKALNRLRKNSESLNDVIFALHRYKGR